MRDIVERLRARADEQERCNSYPIDRAMDREAADIIWRLRHDLDEARHLALSGDGGRAEALEEALRDFVYQATHLSPREDDGSYWCKIPGGTISNARALLQKGPSNG